MESPEFSVFGQELRAMLTEHDLSMRELARQIPINPGQLSRVMNGKRKPSDDLARRCDEILNTGQALRLAAETDRSSLRGTEESVILPISGPWLSADTVAAVSEFTRRDLVLDRRHVTCVVTTMVIGNSLLEPLEQWALHGQAEPSVGRRSSPMTFQEIEYIENAAMLFRTWDDQFGGGLRRKAVVGQLNEVSDLLRDHWHSPALRRRMFGVMAHLSETAATMAWDSGQGETAQAYYIMALRSAKESGDWQFGANVLAAMARQLLYLGRDNDALELLRLAQDGAGSRLSPVVASMLTTREAWAHARQGRLAAFRRATSRAEDLLRDAHGDDGPEPYWIEYFDESELAGVTGGRLLEIAQTQPRLAAEAAEYMERAISLRRPGIFRSSALDFIGLAEARLIQGEPEEAARVGHDAITIIERTRSHRVQVKLAEFHQTSECFHRTRPVGELRDRIGHLLVP